jgi:hypothetical protein
MHTETTDTETTEPTITRLHTAINIATLNEGGSPSSAKSPKQNTCLALNRLRLLHRLRHLCRLLVMHTASTGAVCEGRRLGRHIALEQGCHGVGRYRTRRNDLRSRHPYHTSGRRGMYSSHASRAPSQESSPETRYGTFMHSRLQTTTAILILLLRTVHHHLPILPILLLRTQTRLQCQALRPFDHLVALRTRDPRLPQGKSRRITVSFLAVVDISLSLEICTHICDGGILRERVLRITSIRGQVVGPASG